MNVALIISGILGFGAAFGHTLGGKKMVLSHMKSASFDERAKATISAVWHAISVNFFLLSIALFIIGINPNIIGQSKWLVRFISIHYALYSIAFFIMGLNPKLEKGLLKLFQWIVFLAIAIISWFSL